MESAVRIRTAVLPGGRIEISAPELPPGETVEAIVLYPQEAGARRSALDILADAPAHRLWWSGEEVDAYLQDERDSWAW